MPLLMLIRHITLIHYAAAITIPFSPDGAMLMPCQPLYCYVISRCYAIIYAYYADIAISRCWRHAAASLRLFRCHDFSPLRRRYVDITITPRHYAAVDIAIIFAMAMEFSLRFAATRQPLAAMPIRYCQLQD